MGHGPLAATVMTRLSAAAYALAGLDLPPSEVLRQLNRTALALPQDTLATCAYAVIDPARLAARLPRPAPPVRRHRGRRSPPADLGHARRHHPGPRHAGRPVPRRDH